MFSEERQEWCQITAEIVDELFAGEPGRESGSAVDWHCRWRAAGGRGSRGRCHDVGNTEGGSDEGQPKYERATLVPLSAVRKMRLSYCADQQCRKAERRQTRQQGWRGGLTDCGRCEQMSQAGACELYSRYRISLHSGGERRRKRAAGLRLRVHLHQLYLKQRCMKQVGISTNERSKPRLTAGAYRCAPVRKGRTGRTSKLDQLSDASSFKSQ